MNTLLAIAQSTDWPLISQLYNSCVLIAFIEQFLLAGILLYIATRLYKLSRYPSFALTLAGGLFTLTDAFEKVFRWFNLIYFPDTFVHSQYSIYMTFSRVSMVCTGGILLFVIWTLARSHKKDLDDLI